MSYINLEKKGIESDLAVSLDMEDPSQVAAELGGLGYNVEIR